MWRLSLNWWQLNKSIYGVLLVRLPSFIGGRGWINSYVNTWSHDGYHDDSVMMLMIMIMMVMKVMIYYNKFLSITHMRSTEPMLPSSPSKYDNHIDACYFLPVMKVLSGTWCGDGKDCWNKMYIYCRYYSTK